MRILDKNRIMSNFNRASLSYDRVADVQKLCAEYLVDKIIENFPGFYPSSVLDIGTGTGYMPEFLIRSFKDSEYHINDISISMLNAVRAKLGERGQFYYILGDMEKLEIDRNHPLIVSNFALQWANDLEVMIRKLYSKSNILAFSCLLSGTFEEWGNLLKEHDIDPPIYEYPERADLEKFLLSLNPKNYYFEEKEYQISFESVYAFITYLQDLGANIGSRKIKLSQLKNIIKLAINPFNIKYKVLFCILESDK